MSRDIELLDKSTVSDDNAIHGSFMLCNSSHWDIILSWVTRALHTQNNFTEQSLVENLTVAQLVKEILVFYGTRRKAHFHVHKTCHWAPSWARWIQITSSNLITIHFNMTISPMLRYHRWPLHFRLPIIILHELPSCLIPGTCSIHEILLDMITLIIYGLRIQVMKFLTAHFSTDFYHLPYLGPNSVSTVLKHPQPIFFL